MYDLDLNIYFICSRILAEDRVQHAKLKQGKRKLIDSDKSLTKTQRKDIEVTSDV